MDLRRGLVLAGINLVVAAPMICLLLVQDAQFLHDREQGTGLTQKSQARVAILNRSNAARIVRTQEEQAVAFSPCAMWVHYQAQVYVVELGNLPAFVITEWRVPCPPRWSAAGILGVQATGLLSEANFRAMRRVDLVLCLFIAIQWLLVGSFPLISPQKWWAEPGAFITACTAIASIIALVPAVDGLAKLPALAAFFAWLWWFGLLIWIPIHKAWQSTLGGMRRLSN